MKIDIITKIKKSIFSKKWLGQAEYSGKIPKNSPSYSPLSLKKSRNG